MSRTTAAWFIVGYIVIGIAINISRVGKTRRVKSSAEAACDTIEHLLLIAATLYATGVIG